MVYCLLSCIGIHLHHCLAIVGYSHYWPFCVSAPIVFLHVQMSVVAIIIMYKLYTHIFHLVKALGFFGFLFFISVVLGAFHICIAALTQFLVFTLHLVELVKL